MVDPVPRPQTVHICSECGATALRWAGRCAGCGGWNTLVESARPAPAKRAGIARRPGPGAAPHDRVAGGYAPGVSSAPGASEIGGLLAPERPLLLSEVDPGACVPSATGVEELDRVLAGGLVAGSVTLIGGEPGIGKSTLVLQMVASVASRGVRTLLVAAEEGADQVRQRAERLGTLAENCYIVATGDLQTALEAAGDVQPELLVIDSIQAIGDPTISARFGSTTQVRECAQAFAHFAKATGTATVLVGHVTKDGALAGPRTLEHLVDTVLSFEGDRHHALRLLTATKHRFGTTGELGLFEMAEAGLVGLADPSAMLLADRQIGASGAAVAPIIEGRRALLVEVQVLATASQSSSPRRVVQGVQASRLALLLAVLERSLGLAMRSSDFFVSTVGGIKMSEPASDVAVSLAIVSAITGVPVPDDIVAFGEVGLRGGIRQSPNPQRRLSEAARLGFRKAIGPLSTPSPSGEITLTKIATIADAVTELGLIDAQYAARKKSRARSVSPVAKKFGSHAGRPVASDENPRASLTVVRD
jgi:DNA repair protein RadA/Sms